ncbi:MAG: molybdopterin converting factor subunit 1 [Deltaproteobacteria bacterium]|nr:molybdopterin converting factor subunit 1 [Deltaproteobacteria bacterium]
MLISLRYFAAARERTGLNREQLELASNATVANLLDVLAARHPALAPLLPRLRVAVNQEFAQPETTIPDGAEVALIPPVAGGVELPRVRVTSEKLSLDAVVDAVRGPGQGGIVTFTGSVREQSRGKTVLRLEYEAYADMAEKVLARIVEQARERFGASVAIHHRTGALEIGDVAVVIAAAAAHRAEAFDACRFAIEELKKDVPIWKKEFTTDGDVWVGLGP